MMRSQTCGTHELTQNVQCHTAILTIKPAQMNAPNVSFHNQPMTVGTTSPVTNARETEYYQRSGMYISREGGYTIVSMLPADNYATGELKMPMLDSNTYWGHDLGHLYLLGASSRILA